MEPIVSTPRPDPFDRGPHTDHCDISGDVLIADVREYETPLDLTPEFVAEQTHILDDELAALLSEEGTAPANNTETNGPSDPSPAKAGLLPGFETLTWPDLHLCPTWCVHRNLEVHSDGFDSDPDDAPHRSVEHTIRTIHGGEGIDHAGRAEVTVQLEQDRHHETGPTIVLSVVVNGIEHYTWLSLSEGTALSHALGHLLNEAETQHEN